MAISSKLHSGGSSSISKAVPTCRLTQLITVRDSSSERWRRSQLAMIEMVSPEVVYEM
jgi:hypothetical protein